MFQLWIPARLLVPTIEVTPEVVPTDTPPVEPIVDVVPPVDPAPLKLLLFVIVDIASGDPGSPIITTDEELNQSESLEATPPPDPWFKIATTLYGYTTIMDFAVNAVAGGLLPTDGLIHVESGIYNEAVTVKLIRNHKPPAQFKRDCQRKWCCGLVG